MVEINNWIPIFFFFISFYYDYMSICKNLISISVAFISVGFVGFKVLFFSYGFFYWLKLFKKTPIDYRSSGI